MPPGMRLTGLPSTSNFFLFHGIGEGEIVPVNSSFFGLSPAGRRESPPGNTGTAILRKLSFARSWQCHKYLPPDFPANTTGPVTFAGHVLSEEDISFAKSPFLATARFDLGLAL